MSPNSIPIPRTATSFTGLERQVRWGPTYITSVLASTGFRELSSSRSVDLPAPLGPEIATRFGKSVADARCKLRDEPTSNERIAMLNILPNGSVLVRRCPYRLRLRAIISDVLALGQIECQK